MESVAFLFFLQVFETRSSIKIIFFIARQVPYAYSFWEKSVPSLKSSATWDRVYTIGRFLWSQAWIWHLLKVTHGCVEARAPILLWVVLSRVGCPLWYFWDPCSWLNGVKPIVASSVYFILILPIVNHAGGLGGCGPAWFTPLHLAVVSLPKGLLPLLCPIAPTEQPIAHLWLECFSPLSGSFHDLICNSQLSFSMGTSRSSFLSSFFLLPLEIANRAQAPGLWDLGPL